MIIFLIILLIITINTIQFNNNYTYYEILNKWSHNMYVIYYSINYNPKQIHTYDFLRKIDLYLISNIFALIFLIIPGIILIDNNNNNNIYIALLMSLPIMILSFIIYPINKYIIQEYIKYKINNNMDKSIIKFLKSYESKINNFTLYPINSSALEVLNFYENFNVETTKNPNDEYQKYIKSNKLENSKITL